MTSHVVKTKYTSTPVPLPASFLAPLTDPALITVTPVNFINTTLPEYAGLCAVVLDGVLSTAECKTLISMAEQSTRPSSYSAPDSVEGWRPAMVNVGSGLEVLSPDYRNSDRIIWDDAEVVRRLWKRIMQDSMMRDRFELLEGTKYASVLGEAAVRRRERWRITKAGLNERMRFLKYTSGQFFRPHCDGMYETPDGRQRSFYTLHLYLNDSAQELGIKEGPNPGKVDEMAGEAADELLRGGATTFHSYDEKRRLDVDPRAGRVLIFQHKRLLHSGDDVIAGTKYTMRTDLMYEFEAGDEEEGHIIFEY